MRLRFLVAAAAAAVAAACGDAAGPVIPDPISSISDGRSGGNSNFFFLPPMVANPKALGVFDGNQSPVVEICRLDGDECGPLLAHFTTSLATTTTTAPGNSETVRVGAGHYIVNWHTKRFAIDLGKKYRICVFLSEGGLALGHADVHLVGSGKALKGVDPAFVPLLNGATLPIKVRIEEGAGAQDPDDACKGERYEVTAKNPEGDPINLEFPLCPGDQVVLSAQLLDAADQPILEAGIDVTWTRTGTDAGDFTPPNPSQTNGSGIATVLYTTGEPPNGSERTATFKATDGQGRTGKTPTFKVAGEYCDF